MERGYEILPKDITFRRYAYWFRDFNLDKWTLGDMVKTAPKLCNTLYVAVKTYEIPNHQSKINGIMILEDKSLN